MALFLQHPANSVRNESKPGTATGGKHSFVLQVQRSNPSLPTPCVGKECGLTLIGA